MTRKWLSLENVEQQKERLNVLQTALSRRAAALPTYYEILKIADDATVEQVNKARKLRMVANPNTAMQQEINEAHSVLSVKELRKVYDDILRLRNVPQTEEALLFEARIRAELCGFGFDPIKLANLLNKTSLLDALLICQKYDQLFTNKFWNTNLNSMDDFFNTLHEDRRHVFIGFIPPYIRELLSNDEEPTIENLQEDRVKNDPKKVHQELDEQKFQENFARLLQQLQTTTTALIRKGSPGNATYNRKYEAVATAAKTLIHDLIAAQEVYLKRYSEKSALQDFDEACEDAIDKAEIEFKKHRGVWHQLHPILKAIIGLLATVMIVPAIAVAVFAKDGYKGTFFDTPPTDSAVKLQEFRQEFVNIIAPKY